MSEMKVHGVVKGLVRISEVEQRNVIYIRRDQKVQIREEVLSVG